MQAVEEHFTKNMSTTRALDDIKSKAWTAVRRGKWEGQAFKQLKNKEDAEDAVQEAYTRILEREARGGEIKDLDRYFTIVLRNCISDVHKRNRNTPTTDSSDGSEDYNVPEEQKVYLEDELSRSEKIGDIARVTKHFSKVHQDIFELRYVYQHKYKEIMEVLNVSRPMVNKAIVKLNNALKESNEMGS